MSAKVAGRLIIKSALRDARWLREHPTAMNPGFRAEVLACYIAWRTSSGP